ncbi:BTAD domain-containing putative transcriptional regulator [Nonomuraea antimicrobica]
MVGEAEFRLLGPVGVWAGNAPLGPVAAQQRSVLAILLLNVNRTVHFDRLAAAVWGQEVPMSARNAMQGYVSRLRRVLRDVPDAEVTTSSPGYRLKLDPLRVDVHLARHLVRQARAKAGEPGDDASLLLGLPEDVPDDVLDAGNLLRQALTLWNEPPLGGVAGSWLQETFGASLEEERLAALEDRIAIDVRLGHLHGPLAELPVLLKEHPLRERLVALAMTALHRDGRRADALRIFREARERLVTDLGIEPGADLQRLHQHLLTVEGIQDTSVAADRRGNTPAASAFAVWRRDTPAAAAVRRGENAAVPVKQPRPDRHPPASAQAPLPRELPADLAAFVGRSAEVRLVRDLLGRDAADHVRVCQISGIAGIGKSALAIHAAHALAGRYPDGQLYVDLHGASPHTTPLDPAEVLGRFLRSLGLPGSGVPADLEEAAARFRSMTQGKRLLVVLDNARDAAQVRPLLPGSPTCAVLVTSRRMLTSFDGVLQVPLDVLPDGDALDLLTRLAGEQRITAERAAAADLVRLCGGHPWPCAWPRHASTPVPPGPSPCWPVG